MKKILLLIAFGSFITACGNKRKLFEVGGKITNATNKKILLQYLVWGAERPTVVDSSSLQKDGSFILSTAYGKEESMYELIFDSTKTLLLINDNEKILLTLDVNNYKHYTVNGSKASTALHEFLDDYRVQYLELVSLMQQADTIQNSLATDSTKTVVKLEKENELQKVNGLITTTFKNTSSPALQYYLTAKAFATMPIRQIQQLNNVAVAQHATHSGLAFLKSIITKEIEKQKTFELANLKRQKDSVMRMDTLKKSIRDIDTTAK